MLQLRMFWRSPHSLAVFSVAVWPCTGTCADCGGGTSKLAFCFASCQMWTPFPLELLRFISAAGPVRFVLSLPSLLETHIRE